MRGRFWHVVYVELIWVEEVILRCVFPHKSSEFYWVVGVVPVVEHGNGEALIKAVAHGDGLPRV